MDSGLSWVESEIKRFERINQLDNFLRGNINSDQNEITS